jgi:RNA-directed DNA polymerase
MNKLKNIHTTIELARLLCVDHDKQLIHFLYNRKASNYVKRQITKRSGGIRTIYIPHPTIMYMQKQFARLLDEIYLPPKNVHGFIKGRSVISNAKTHLLSNEILNIDLEDFFGNINFGRVYGVLQAKPFSIRPNVAAVLAQLACHNGAIAQGAPSSPVISNIIARQLDRKLIEFSRVTGLRYSRYADDITLSPIRVAALSSVIENISPLKLNKEVVDLIKSCGFNINSSKLKYSTAHQKRQVTGIIINEKLNVKRKYIRNIRAILFDWDLNGLDKMCLKYIEKNSITHFKDNQSAIRSIRGKIDWVGHVRGRDDAIYIKIAELFNYLCERDSVGTKLKIVPNEFARLRDMVFVVEFELRQGTAFSLDNVGVITAAHVCDSHMGTLIDSEGRRHDVLVKYIDFDRDLAILEVLNKPLKNHIKLSSATAGALIGKSVMLVGYPNYSDGRSLHLARGEVLSRHHGRNEVYVSTEIFSGNSGGPLLDENGDLIAIALRGPGGNAALDQENICVLASELEKMSKNEFIFHEEANEHVSPILMKRILKFIFKKIDDIKKWSHK